MQRIWHSLDYIVITNLCLYVVGAGSRAHRASAFSKILTLGSRYYLLTSNLSFDLKWLTLCIVLRISNAWSSSPFAKTNLGLSRIKYIQAAEIKDGME